MTPSPARTRRSLTCSVAIGLSAAVGAIAGPATGAGDNGISLVSRSSMSGLPADSSSTAPSVSDSGKYVCFDSTASDIVAGDADNTVDVFRYNTDTQAITLVSRTPAGKPGGRRSWNCQMSDNGRYVVYESTSPAVAPGLDGRAPRIVLYDAVAHTASIVSKTLDGTPKTARTFGIDISGDGRYVVYVDLQPSVEGGNHDYDIYRYDRATDTTTSLVHEGAATRATLNAPSISEDGRYVAYLRTPAKGKQVVGSTSLYLLDTLTGTTTLVSETPKGTLNGAASPDLSDNGRFLTFVSTMNSVAPGDTNIEADVFLYDAANGTTSLVSRNPSGQAGDDRSFMTSISGNGRYIAFASNASDLVTGDEDEWADIFRYDRVTGATRLISLASDGGSSVASTISPSIGGGQGEKIAFVSDGVDFVPGDTSFHQDVFLWTLPQ